MKQPQTATDKALAERERLARHYRAAKKLLYKTMFDDPQYGSRLRQLSVTLRHFGIDDSGDMVDYVTRQTHEWLRAAPTDVRYTALEMIGSRIIRVRQNADLCEFDDPLPGEPDDIFQVCKRELGL